MSTPNEPQNPFEKAPEPGHRARWLRTINNQITDADVVGAYATVEQLLSRMESLLAAGPYLFGAEYTLADVEATPLVVRLQHLDRGRADAGGVAGGAGAGLAGPGPHAARETEL